ncbi:hypothetical protein B7494_g580 [Chlorociboria aeruginascens]|nr:hypothetical protein B7494_g580 [Chlorociboria aeruginascens]
MAPAGRKPTENQFPFDLGHKGRKTGVTLPDTGIRDEYGMEPMEGLFSSPAKPKSTRITRNGTKQNTDTTVSSEEDMELVDSTILEPTAVLTERKGTSQRLLPPYSKSPIKTHLNSPAKRNPSMGLVTSPTRGSIVEPVEVERSAPVRRRLDFSSDELGTKKSAAKKEVAIRKLTNGTRLSPSREASLEDNEDEEEDTAEVEDDTELGNGDSYQIMNGDDENDHGVEDDIEVQPEPKPELKLSKKALGKRKAVGADASEAPAPAKSRGRPKKVVQPVSIEEGERPNKKTRHSHPDVDADEPGNPAPTKAKASRSNKNAKPAQTVKPIGKRQKLAPTAEAESPDIRRGPPIPRNNRGLFILRRETPMESTGFKQTRSGRNSHKPLAFWKNERFEYEEEEVEEKNGARFVLPRIKEVVRADEVEGVKRTRMKPKSKKSRKRQGSESEEESETEAWELEPGRVQGEVRIWNPEDPIGAESEEREEEIAWSSAAIITRDTANSAFKFAKTLTLPFFGSGMVDLPPGAIKKLKNSRKMQMVFFVYCGRVQVTVNDNMFRISKGGMWQVPRGNFYSIENDYDKPARIFFCQGCGVTEETSAAPDNTTPNPLTLYSHNLMAPLLDSSLKTSLSLSPSAKIEKYGGGGFASTFKIRDTDSSGNEHCYFVKTGEGDQADVMFTGEHTSLNALHAISNTLAPRSYAHGVLASSPTSHFLATQFLTLRPASSPSSLARKLALLHSTPAPTPPGYKTPQFGFPVSTCCGRTVQCNAYSASWSAFYASNRLRPILDLCLKTQGPDPELQTRGRDVTAVVVPSFCGTGI